MFAKSALIFYVYTNLKNASIKSISMTYQDELRLVLKTTFSNTFMIK